MAFAVLVLCYFQKLQLLIVKRFWTNFCCICISIFMSSKRVSEILKILFQTGDIYIFVLRGVFSSRYVQLKSSFSDKKKHQLWNLRNTLVEKLSKIMWQILKENSIIDRSWSSAKLFIVQDYTENANGDVPLILENVWYFCFLWVQDAHKYKRFLFYGNNVNQLR